MRKLLLILSLFALLLNAEGQILRYPFYAPKASATTVDSANWETEYKTVYYEMATPPGIDTADWQNDLVEGLVDGGFWADMDLLYIFANRVQADALINWIDPGTFNADNPTSTAFVKYFGFQGNGADDYISTNYIPDTDATNATLNSTAVGIYLLDDEAGSGTDYAFSAYESTTIRTDLRARAADDNVNAYVNSGGIGSAANTTTKGMFIISRTASNATGIYLGQNTLDTDTDASVDTPNVEMYLFGKVSGTQYFGSNSAAIFFIMSGVTAANADDIDTIIETYMDKIGAGVQ